MAESVRELRGDPSYVLDCLAQQLARDKWTVTTRAGPLLQARCERGFLSLTALSSAHGTRVHAEGSHSAVAYFRRTLASEGAPPREFSVAGRRRHLGAAIIAGLSLIATVGVLLVSGFCQSPPPSQVTTAMTRPTAVIPDISPALREPAQTPAPPSVTPVVRRPTPAQPVARASRPTPQPTPSAVVPSVTPTPSRPTPKATPTRPAAVTPTTTRLPLRPPATPVAPTPTIDLSRLADAMSN
jgi:hypothetical protein